MKITTVGVDLAKNVFQVHAVDEDGKVALRKQLKREQMATFFVNLPSCLIGMEACAIDGTQMWRPWHWKTRMLASSGQGQLDIRLAAKPGCMAAIFTFEPSLIEGLANRGVHA